MSGTEDFVKRVMDTAERHAMVAPNAPALVMVSGGSDSTALAYLASEMVSEGKLGDVAMLHVNHKLRGADSDEDALFVQALADSLGIPLFLCEVDIAGMVERFGGNVEAVARSERYRAAREAVESMCLHRGFAFEDARVFTAHTADDRVENFFMRAIVGTGPGGFRSMEHCVTIEGCRVCRPLLEVGRDELRAFIEAHERPVRDEQGALWREDATNADTDRFRAFVRHEIVPLAKKRNPRLLQTLTRTMNLIADEDDMLSGKAREVLVTYAAPLGDSLADGVVFDPRINELDTPLVRRVMDKLLTLMLPYEERVEAASVEACVRGLGKAGYVANIQGNLAVTYNKHGLRIEPMAAFRARRKKG